MGIFDVFSYLAIGLGVAGVATVAVSLLLAWLSGSRPSHTVRIEVDGRVISDVAVASLSASQIKSVADEAAERYEHGRTPIVAR
jgi:hypothetical protein